MSDSADRPGPGRRGLQPERTALAWDRTGLSFIVVGALLLRAGRGPVFPNPGHLPGALSILLGGLLVGLAVRMRPRGPGGAATRPQRLLLVRMVGVTAIGISVSALALILLGA